ncbi:RNA-directed DNA polymerase, eukaryota, reverse transcriptase zinc-binding domain protein [Tanacetum coccineum]
MHKGVWISDPLHVKESFLNFFKEKFQPHVSLIDFPSISTSNGLNPSNRDMLEKEVTLPEIKNVVWDYGRDKAPKPDGFTFGFVKRYWDILKLDIHEFVSKFLGSKKMQAGSNSSFITLILKIDSSCSRRTIYGYFNYADTDESEVSLTLTVLEAKIKANTASSDDRSSRINLLQELNKIDNLEALDLFQKSRIKLDVEGDENSKFFHGLVNQRRRTNSLQGIMHEGVWIPDPLHVKEPFLNFFKEKFQPHVSSIDFPSISTFNGLNPSDRDMLKRRLLCLKSRTRCGIVVVIRPLARRFYFWFRETLLGYSQVSNPIHIKDFHHISLINIHYKIIAKVLANRISKVVNKIVSHEQSAFISDRQILNGPLMLSEMIDWTSILVNGSPTSEFSVKRGLRQGDPLLPFLFILVMEGLHIALSKATRTCLIWGVKIGVSEEEVSSMANHTGCNSGSFPFTYLGLPISSNMNHSSNWKILIDRFQSRLSKWKANLLSIGGRLTLIKSVLGSLGIYYLSFFKALDSVLKTLESIRALFFWGGSQGSSKLAWVKWPTVLASLGKGGLGIGSLKLFNLTLIQKRRWRFFSNPNALWVNVIRSLLGHEGGFDHAGCSTKGCGSIIRFWKDLWIGDSPLYLRYNRLFRLEQDKDYLIIDRIHNSQWSLNWSRSDLGTRNEAYLNDLINEISQVVISSNSDACYWSIDNNGVFTVGITRKHLDDHLLSSSATSTCWDKTLPRKVNIFLWRLKIDRLPHRLNLSTRGIEISDISCPSCSGSEPGALR